MSKEAMKLALGKIKSARDCHPNAVDVLLFEAEEILEEALEQPAQKCSYPYCGCNSKAWCKVERNEALDKMAENARELGLDYEPAQQEPWPDEPKGHMAGGVQLSGTSKSKAITELYALFGAPHNADINLTGLNRLLDELIASPPAQPMHPEIKKMYEDYFDKCFRESSAAVPENFMDALKFDVAMRECVMEPAQDSGIVTAGGFDPRTQRTWVDLTDDEIKKEFHPLHATGLQFARAVLAKSKEKNT